MSRDLNSRVDIGVRLCPFHHSLDLSSPFCKYKFPQHKLRDRYSSDSDSRLNDFRKDKLFYRVYRVSLWSRCITFGTEFSFKTEGAIAFSVRAITVTIAIGHFAFIVPQITLFSFPSRIALTLAVNVFASLTAQYWTNAYNRKFILNTILLRSSTQEHFFFLNISHAIKIIPDSSNITLVYFHCINYYHYNKLYFSIGVIGKY